MSVKKSIALLARCASAAAALMFLTLGGCEILVPNAGGPRPGTFDELSDEDFRTAFELNVLSTITGKDDKATVRLMFVGCGLTKSLVKLSLKTTASPTTVAPTARRRSPNKRGREWFTSRRKVMAQRWAPESPRHAESSS